jgi:hypothetical protein
MLERVKGGLSVLDRADDWLSGPCLQEVCAVAATASYTANAPSWQRTVLQLWGRKLVQEGALRKPSQPCKSFFSFLFSVYDLS